MRNQCHMEMFLVDQTFFLFDEHHCIWPQLLMLLVNHKSVAGATKFQGSCKNNFFGSWFWSNWRLRHIVAILEANEPVWHRKWQWIAEFAWKTERIARPQVSHQGSWGIPQLIFVSLVQSLCWDQFSNSHVILAVTQLPSARGKHIHVNQDHWEKT